MGLSKSIMAYQDCIDFLEKCLDSPTGARMWFRSEKEAQYWRLRCNQARTLHRDVNSQKYDIGHQLYDTSEYDQLSLVIKQSTDGLHWVYGEKRELNPGNVEPIPIEESHLADQLTIEHQETLLLEHCDAEDEDDLPPAA